MTGSVPSTLSGVAGWNSLVSDPSGALVAFDFDGTLAPIVADPEQAYTHPDVVGVLGRLGTVVGGIAIVTGRPVDSVLRLASPVGVLGLHGLVILGQYGVERWVAGHGAATDPPPPAGLVGVRDELPRLLETLSLQAAHVEDKGRAIAVHVRRLPDPDDALQRLRAPIAELAARHLLTVEPGRQVLELRASGIDKGQALRSLADEMGASCVVFGGDDLGDVAAYDAVDAMRRQGRPGILICSASGEQEALAPRADVVVVGPDGLVGWLGELADQLGV